MKKITTLFVIILFFSTTLIPLQTNAQQGCAWAKKAGGNNEDYGTAVATDASGNVFYLGNFFSQTITIGTTVLQNQPYQAFNYGSEMFLAKYDSCGTFKWAKKAGGDADTYGNALAIDAAGNVYVTGYFQDSVAFGSIKLATTGYKDIFVAKYDNNGVPQWAIQGNGSDQDMAYGIAADAGGDVYVTGNFVSPTLTFGVNSVSNGTNDGYTNDVFIAKFDASGNNYWVTASTSHNSTSNDAFGRTIGIDAAGNAYVGGKFESGYIRFGNDSAANNGYVDLYLVKYNTNGAEQWLRTAGGTNADAITSLATDANGNTYVTGYIGGQTTVSLGGNSITNSGQNREIFISKYDPAGANLWARITKGDYWSDNIATSVSLDASGSAFITGTYSSDSLHVGAVTLFNTSYLNGNGGDYFYDIFVAKYKSNGNLSWARSAGGDSTDIGYGIATGLNNSLYLTGEFISPTLNLSGITLTRTNNSLAGDGDAFICNNIAMDTMVPSICLVSADSMVGTNQYNMIYWDKTIYTNAASFIIYREVSTGIYKKIGAQPYSALSEFVDTARSVGPANGDPAVGTYKYAIQMLDTAGTYTGLSPYHNTVYFQNNAGTFNWNLYTVGNPTVTPVSNFNLMRDNLNNGIWTLVGSVSGTQTSLTDPNYATYQAIANWRVEATTFNCTPTSRQGNNSTTSAIVKSKSNITNNRGIGVAQINEKNIPLFIYPNPATNMVQLSSSKELGLVSIYNSLGQIIYQTKTTDTDLQVDISRFNAGIYTLHAQGKNTRLVKE